MGSYGKLLHSRWVEKVDLATRLGFENMVHHGTPKIHRLIIIFTIQIHIIDITRGYTAGIRYTPFSGAPQLGEKLSKLTTRGGQPQVCLGSWGLEMTVLLPCLPCLQVAGNNGLLFAFSKVDTR